MNVFSFGGGIQSMAGLVLAKRGLLDMDYFVFANVGEDSESPATIAYVRDVALPFAERHGIRLEAVRYTRKDGTQPTIRETALGEGKSVKIPARYPRTGRPMARQCTETWKIRPVNKFVREHGATRYNPATINIGISWDEAERVNLTSYNLYTRRAYPFVERRITREMCASYIIGEGLPLPPKSACWFCPYTSPQRWREARIEDAALFEQAARFEEELGDKTERVLGLRAYLTRFGKPLREAIPVPVIHRGSYVQLTTDLFDGCESGYCFV